MRPQFSRLPRFHAIRSASVSLAARYERPPATHRARGYRFGDTEASLYKAWQHYVDAWDLIDFNLAGTKQTKQINFPLATRQVNWYLSECVGFETPSADGHSNWAFTSGLTKGKGGVILRRDPCPFCRDLSNGKRERDGSMPLVPTRAASGPSQKAKCGITRSGPYRTRGKR
jgi:hypothetical protein